MARDGTVGWLREVCGDFRRDLLSAEHATADEIAAIWPGGEKNPGRKLKDWIRCYGKLHAMNAVAVRARVDARDIKGGARQAAILDALADKPETVTLLEPDATGDPRTLTVFPKSYVALSEVHNRNVLLALLLDECALLEQHGRPDDIELLVRARAEETYLQRVIVWIATTPGPGLPYPEGLLRPEPPALFHTLHPADLYALSAAFQRVNVARLLSLDATRGKDTRPDWSVFFASLGEAMNRPTPEVMRDTSLSAIIAQAAERARGQEQALLAAERRAQDKQSHGRQRKVA